MCTYVCSSAQLFISRNNDFEIRANEYSLTHSQFQLHSLSPLPPLFPTRCPILFPSPLLLFPLYYPFYRGCLRFIGHGSVARVGGVEDSPEVSPSACVSNRSPLFVWFARRVSPRGRGSAAVSIDGRRPISFCFVVPRRRTLFPHAFRPHRRTQTLAVWLASSKLRSVTVVPFSLVTIHIPLLLSWIHRGENPTMQACLYAPTMCLPLIFPSASIFFFPSSLRVLPFRPLINPLLTRERERVRKFVKPTDFEPTDRNDIVSSLLRIAFESVKAEQSSPTDCEADCCCVFP